MKNFKRKAAEVIEIEPLVACLKSAINVEISRKAYFSITPKFYHKSGSELRLEEQQRTKLLTAGQLKFY
jgi:hypothetical protein